jgi:Spy/CpxP family protein refolding chaperone
MKRMLVGWTGAGIGVLALLVTPRTVAPAEPAHSVLVDSAQTDKCGASVMIYAPAENDMAIVWLLDRDERGPSLHARPACGRRPEHRAIAQLPRPPMALPGRGRWWKNADVVRELSLTEAQVSEIEQTFLEHRLKLIDLRAALDKHVVLLQLLMDADRPDEAKIAAQLELVLAARARLEKTQAMMVLAVHRLLSPEQWRRLEALDEGYAAPAFDPPVPRRVPPRRSES